MQILLFFQHLMDFITVSMKFILMQQSKMSCMEEKARKVRTEKHFSLRKFQFLFTSN